MNKKTDVPLTVNSITEFCELMSLPKPEHPLLSVIDLSKTQCYPAIEHDKFLYNFYGVSIKKNIKGAIRYGRKYYDFSEGTMAFSAPNQVFFMDKTVDISAMSGWYLVFHADLIRRYALSKKISTYNFFSYEVNEALHLSDKEEAIVEKLMREIRSEYQERIDGFSQDVIVSQIEVLLNYSNRFYHRQFITRSSANNELLSRFETALQDYFEKEEVKQLPGVHEIALQLNVSSHYLSDMLRAVSGQNAQQHIHNFIIEKAKNYLLMDGLTVNETAYRLGFEYPQYFNRLFKNKTGITPMQFKQSTF